MMMIDRKRNDKVVERWQIFCVLNIRAQLILDQNKCTSLTIKGTLYFSRRVSFASLLTWVLCKSWNSIARDSSLNFMRQRIEGVILVQRVSYWRCGWSIPRHIEPLPNKYFRRTRLREACVKRDKELNEVKEMK